MAPKIAPGETKLLRHTLFIHEDSYNRLVKESQETGAPVNEIIRRAILAHQRKALKP